MALTKHQKLARALREMRDRIDAFYDQVEEQLSRIQFHTYDPLRSTLHPMTNPEALQADLCNHRIEALLYSPSEVEFPS